MKIDIKVPKKVLDVQDLLRKNEVDIRVHKAISKIANSPLPRHKAQKYEDLLAEAYVKLYNSTGKFRKAYEKMSEPNRRIFLDLERSTK